MTRHLLQGHQKFHEEYFAEREFLERLAEEGQRPKALFIGCCDSRVIPEYLTSSGFGELFVLRNIANFVPPLEHADDSVGAAIDYALESLNVPDVIVCGHLGCGGIVASLGDIEPLREGRPSLFRWLDSVATGTRPVAAATDLTGDALLDEAVRENVLCALENLLTYDSVRRRLDDGALHMHGWIYDMRATEISVYDHASTSWRSALDLRASRV
ncbi:MAG: carbonic anhydrase [Polyangiales bacterium]